MKTIYLKPPKGYMNFGITTANNFVGDTNDSKNWDEIIFPLPKGKWEIKSRNVVGTGTWELIDKRNWFQRLFNL